MAGWPPKSMKMPAGGRAQEAPPAQGRRPTGFRQRAQGEEFSRQKAKISEPGRWPGWAGTFAARQEATFKRHRRVAAIKTIVNDSILNE